jgi:hypothetical protein
MEVKTCSKCKEVKNFSDFSKRKATKDGFQNQCKQCLNNWQKENYNRNKDRINQRRQAYYYANHEESKRKLRERRKTEHVKIWRAKCHKENYNNNECYKLKMLIRRRTSKAFKSKGVCTNIKTLEILGVSVDIAKAHLEKQFTKGMSWGNHGEWHIDHIIPLASANTEEEIIKLCHYTNLQPLWAKDNLEKSDKIIETQMKLGI